MTLESMMSLEGIIAVVLVIAAVGAGITHMFRNAESPYLITIAGSRTELIGFGALLWIVAIGAGFGALLAVSVLTSPIVGLAVFFGVEAVALDICAHRTRYVRVSSPVVQHARVRVTLP